MVKKINILILVLFGTGNLLAQNDIPVGTWRSHFNYEQTLFVELVGERIYAASPEGLVFYDEGENSLSEFSKVDGLSDVNISAMSYDNSGGLLVIGYANGNLDIIAENEITNITRLKDSDIIDGKRINDISFHSGLIYLSTNFGVLVLDPTNGQIKEAFQNLGPQGQTIQVFKTTFSGNEIFLATQIGVLMGLVAENVNLQDFNNWERFEGSLIENVLVSQVVFFSDRIYASTPTQIFVFDGSAWSNIGYDAQGEEIKGLKSSNNGLLIIRDNSVQSRSSFGSIVAFNLGEDDMPNDAFQAADNTLWYADNNAGLSNSRDGTITRFVPNGIFNDEVVRLELVANQIYAFPKSSDASFVAANNGLGYSFFENGTWTSEASDMLNSFEDITDLTFISADSPLISSYGKGILDVNDEIIYDATNSPLSDSGVGATDQVIVTALEADRDGNVWVANWGTNSLLMLSPEKTWESYAFGITAGERPADIRISSTSDIWMILDREFGGGIMAFDPESKSSRYINAANGNLPSTKVTDLEFDKEGQIWIGTEAGIAYFPFTQGVIDDNAIEVIRPVFGNRFLLEDEFITSIEVDEGNRKWIGTRDGLWLFEDAGDAIVTSFTTENSPLPSNNILDIKIDPNSGEVFVATEVGMVSYRGDAFKGSATHQSVKIFPNPVHPGYTGLIGISGLATDVNIKITNVSGRLIREINASGGGASWDLMDYNGRRAQSGVYLVFSATSDGSETFVGKVAIVN